MIFPKLLIEEVVQVDDKTRLDASETFSTNETIKDILIDAGTGFISVFHNNKKNWFIDWAFGVEGQVDVALKVIDTNDIEYLKEYTIAVLTFSEDALFSRDQQLFSYESELKSQLPMGKSSYNYAHRTAQKEIIRYLDGEGIRKDSGVPFGKLDLVGNTYISEWSIFQTLINILEDQRVSNSDIFEAKRKNYMAKLIDARKNAAIRLDFNENNEIDPKEVKNTQMKWLTR